MPYATGSYGSLSYGGDFGGHVVPPLPVHPSSSAWWWSGPAARMLADAGFLLLVQPDLEAQKKKAQDESK